LAVAAVDQTKPDLLLVNLVVVGEELAAPQLVVPVDQLQDKVMMVGVGLEQTLQVLLQVVVAAAEVPMLLVVMEQLYRQLVLETEVLALYRLSMEPQPTMPVVAVVVLVVEQIQLLEQD
jgi:hypothetical protein